MKLRILINGKEADIDEKVRLPITKKFSDLENPTAYANDYSGTITLPSTPVNDLILENIGVLDQVIGDFNPSQRVPITILINDELFHDGYFKLTGINRKGGRASSYNIHVYGGIGDFFYELGEKDAADIEYPSNLQHIIDARRVVYSNSASPYMRYMMCYNGLYDKFQNDKIWSQEKNDFIDIEGGDKDEHQMLEFRSYYQRPALKVSEMMRRIMDQSTYEVETSAGFFNSANPYWDKTYISMPQYEVTDQTTEETAIVAAGGTSRTILTLSRVGSARAVIPFISSTNTDILKNNGTIDTTSINGRSAVSGRMVVSLTAYSPGFDGRLYMPGGASLTINLYFGNTLLKSIPYQKSVYSDVYPALGYRRVGYPFSTVVEFNKAVFEPTTTQLSAEIVYTAPDGSTGGTIQWRDSAFYGRAITFSLIMKDFDSNQDLWVKVNYNNAIRSGATVDYSMMMPRGTSQLQFLLNYCKIFGLIFEKERNQKKISIMSRNEFFADYQVLDWTEKIDHKRSSTIKPLSFDYRYGMMGWASSDTKYTTQFKEKYNIPYGAVRIDTGYAFDSSEKNLLDKNIYQNVAMSMEYDHWFTGRNTEANRDDKILPAFFTLSNNTRDRADTQFSMLFFEGTKRTRGNIILKFTDDNSQMVVDNNFTWGGSVLAFNDQYPSFTRVMEVEGETYSLDFAKPAQTYYPVADVNYPASATLYSRFWQAYIEETLNVNNRHLTAYFYLTPAEVASWRFNTFVRLDNTLWHVVEISDYDIANTASTKVELVRVQNIDAYINGQKLSWQKYQ